MPFLWIQIASKMVTVNGMSASPRKSVYAWPSPNKNIKKCFAQSITPLWLTNYVQSIKRVSLFLLRKMKLFLAFLIKNSVCASMTLEAAAVLPLLLFFFLNITSSMEMMRLHGNLRLALWETGSRMAVYGYVSEELNIWKREEGEERSILDNLAGIVFSYLYVKNEIIDYLGEDYLESSPLSHGTSGLNFLESSFMEEEDCIDLVVTYQVCGPFSIPGFSSFRMTTRYYGKAWTGYELPLQGKTESDRDCVYITETGSVYHETRECSHIKLQIKAISSAELPHSRNMEGNSYTLCWICGDEDMNGLIFIAEFGDRYHYIRGCSGLKRTITTIKRTDTEGYRPCGRCGGG